MIDKSEFYGRVMAHGGELSIDYVAQVVMDMWADESKEEILLRAARVEARELMRVENDEGDRIFLNYLNDEGERVWLQEELFDAEQYQRVIDENEQRIEALIRRNARLEEKARNKGYDVQLRFQLFDVLVAA